MSWSERLRSLPRQLPYVWLFCMLAGLLFSLITVLCANGWPVEGLLYSDRMDVLMDHFNSIRTVRNGDPYLEYRTTYPPLAALFYTFFYSILTDDAVHCSIARGMPRRAPCPAARNGELTQR